MADPQLPAGYTVDVPPPAGYTLDAPTSAPGTDLLSQALNYRIQSNPVADYGLGVLQGAGKGAVEQFTNLSNLVGKLPPVKALDDVYWRMLGKAPPPPEQVSPAMTANAPGQGTGKFLLNAAEFLVPAGEVGKALETAPVLARMAGQAAVGAGVSGVQSNFDPTAMTTGAVLGAGGELAGTTVNQIRQLASMPKILNARNLRDSFAAVPTQLTTINEALPTLQKLGVAPADSVPEMKAAIDQKLADLGQQFQTKMAAGVGDKTMPAQDIIDQLEKQKAEFKTSQGKVPTANKSYVDALDSQIQDIYDATDAKTGKIAYKDLKTLRDAANKKTNWLDPDKDLYKNVGNIYRGGMDTIEPGMRELNRDYMNLSKLSGVAEKNMGMGRGMMPSRLDELGQKWTAPATGAIIGTQAGGVLAHALGASPLVGETIGAIGGGYVLPRIAKPVYTALQNAVDSGAFARLPQTQKAALAIAVKLGDNAAIQRILTPGIQSAATSVINPVTGQ